MDRFTDLQIYIIKILDELIDVGTKENIYLFMEWH